MKITIKQYKSALTELSPKHLDILKTLYYFPNSSATPKNLASALGYRGYQGANRQIGAIGKKIGDFLNVIYETYYDSRSGDRNAYFNVIGPFKTNGWEMWPNLRKALLELGLISINESLRESIDRLPTEIENYNEATLLKEGKVTQILVNKFERNFIARQKCLNHHGRSCVGCGFDFGRIFGKYAEGYIHVHHTIPLHTIGKQYIIDPVKDLVPLCPNCHVVVHMTNPVMTVQELKAEIRKVSKKIKPSSGTIS